MANPTTATGTSDSKTKTPARTWLMILGWVLLATAILGLVPAAVDALHDLQFHIEGGEDAIHWALAAATLLVAYLARDALLNTLAIVFAVVYLGAGLLGFFVDSIGPWHVAIGDNILHLALGAITLATAIASRNRVRQTGRMGRAAA
jgi:hypothetical protein